MSGLAGQDPDYGLGSSTQWNISVERELARGVRLELGYQGNSSTSTPTGIPTNLPGWADGANDSGSSYQSRRPDQFLGDNGMWVYNDGRTKFDQLLLIGRAHRADVFAQLSWAWTHARRNFGGTSAVQGNRDWDSSIAFPYSTELMQDFQNNHTIAGFLVWDLPVYRHDTGTKGKILGGWQITANGYWSFWNKGSSVFAGYDANANSWGDDLAKVNGGISYPKTPITGEGDLLYQWFDTGAFSYPNGTLDRVFGPTTVTDGLNVLDELPGSWRVDAGLMKTIVIAGAARLQLRFETFNLFNHANLNWPNTSVNSPDFGRIRGKNGDARRIQMGIRFIF